MTQISHLRAFVEAAAEGSFIAASDRLHLSHSSVSARIKALENELGVRLFHRGRHGVALNDVGVCLLPFAETILQSWNQAVGSVRAVATGNLPLRAGIQQDLWGIFGAAWFERLKAELPMLQLHLTSDYSTQLCESVSKRLLDIAVIFEPFNRRGVELERIAEFPLLLASSEVRAWSGQLPQDYLYIGWGRAFEEWHYEQFGARQQPSLVVGVSDIALGMVRQHGGAAFFLQHSLAPLLESGDMHLVEGAPPYAVSVYLVIPKHVETTEMLEQARASIRAVVSAAS